jgi:CHAT domain-containing protein
VEELQDEGIHLMAACQLAGFQHVIGSIWEVSDKHCVDVAKDVYEEILQSRLSDDSVSRGLHKAALNLREGPGAVPANREARDAVPVGSGERRIGDPRIWGAYIHMGM